MLTRTDIERMGLLLLFRGAVSLNVSNVCQGAALRSASVRKFSICCTSNTRRCFNIGVSGSIHRLLTSCVAVTRQGATLGSKLVLLTLHFPRLRLLWSRSLHATADLFRTLKEGRDEPDPVLAASIGAQLRSCLSSTQAAASPCWPLSTCSRPCKCT